MSAEPKGVLCYVSRRRAWFTTAPLDKQWGDDWNDAPYEHNADWPYKMPGYDLTLVWFDPGEMVEPDDGVANSRWSVEDINAQQTPWLTTTEWSSCPPTKIWAGASFREFQAALLLAGGTALMPWPELLALSPISHTEEVDGERGVMKARPSRVETSAFVSGLFHGVHDKGGQPFVLHCSRVALRVEMAAGSADEWDAAYLHDVLEDTATTAGDLRAMGYSERTVWLVERLTHREGLTYLDYIRSIADSGDAGLIRIKLADNADNSDPARIAAIPTGERGFTRRYAKARAILDAALSDLTPDPL